MTMRPLDPRWWKGKRVLVTGADGFIGRRVVSWLREWELVPSAHIRQFSLPDGDLRSPSDARWAVTGCDVILHLAADVGGAGYSRTHPAEQYYNCSMIDLAMVEAARHAGVGRIVLVGCSTAYPSGIESPLRETTLFDGLPDREHLGYGLAKRNAVMLASLYAGQHEMSIAAIVASDAYGPGDHFDATSQIVAGLIMACCSNPAQLNVNADGQVIGDFVFIDDLVVGLLLATEHLPAGAVANVGSGSQTSIATLVQEIATLTSYSGPVVFNGAKASAAVQRPLDISRARTLFGYAPDVTLRSGLRQTLEWYQQQLPGKNGASG